MFSLTDIQMLLWCCRYLKINKYLRFWFFSARDPSRRYISMVIYAPQAQVQERRANQWDHWGRTSSTGICGVLRRGTHPGHPPELFDSCTSKHGQKHSSLRWRLQRDEGPHYNVVPHSNREIRLRLRPANNKTSFFIRPTRG